MRIPVSVTSDFICPWCFIGRRRLLSAVAALPSDWTVDITWLPFELNPDLPSEGISRRDYRIAKFGSWERSLRLDAEVVSAAAGEGLTVDYDRQTWTPNTRRAHRLMRLAQTAGADQNRLAEALFRAYFTDGRDIGAPAVLVELAGGLGLDPHRVAAFLDGTEEMAEVRALEAEMLRRGIGGVPFFNIWGIGASGAVPPDLLRQVFDEAVAVRTGLAAAGPGTLVDDVAGAS